MKASGKPPISRNPDEVQRRILDAAEAEFMINGYEVASTNSIVARFGGSKATLFRHFPTKEQLLQAVIERIARNWSSSVQPDRIPEDGPGEWLEAFGIVMLEWILTDRPLFIGRLGISEGHKLTQLNHLFHELAGAPLEAEVAARLKKWTERGDLSSADPEADARSFFDLMVAGPVSRALYGVERLTGPALHSHAARGVDIFLNGRLARPQASAR